MQLFSLTLTCALLPLVLGIPLDPLFKRQAKTPVNAATYQKLAYYAGFPTLTQALASGSCPSPANGAELIQYLQVTSTDTQAGIWKSASTKELVVAFPGTDSLQDIFTDLDSSLTAYNSVNTNCPAGCQAHHGYLGAWNSIASDLIAGLTAALHNNPGYTTVISGHSLGGALGALAFASLKNGPYRVAALYTYGQPRVGNPALANYLDALSGASDANPGIYHRVTHANDGVTQFPAISSGYFHSRTEYWESATPAELASTYRCYGQEPADCVDSTGGSGVNAAHSSYAGLDISCS